MEISDLLIFAVIIAMLSMTSTAVWDPGLYNYDTVQLLCQAATKYILSGHNPYTLTVAQLENFYPSLGNLTLPGRTQLHDWYEFKVEDKTHGEGMQRYLGAYDIYVLQFAEKGNRNKIRKQFLCKNYTPLPHGKQMSPAEFYNNQQ